MIRLNYYVYILTNVRNTVYYTGITSNLIKRIWEHKNKFVSGFTKKYNIEKLVYLESFNDSITAIKREKEIKGWIRKKKLDLIREHNSTFRDLYPELV